MEEAMDGFILGPKSQRLESKSECTPALFEYQQGYVNPTAELIPTGRTPVVKFITTAGVFTSESFSLKMYFSPFQPKVWLAFLISAGITVAGIIGVLEMEGTQDGGTCGRLSAAIELATWAFASAIGHYKHSDVPLISGHCWFRGTMWILAPLVVSWFIVTTFLVSIYSAIFNSDATQPFHYLTNYTEFFQLPPHEQFYFLVNESYARTYQAQSPIKVCTVERKLEANFCKFVNFVPTACGIRPIINSAIMLVDSTVEGIDRTSTNSKWRMSEKKRLQEEGQKLADLMTHLTILFASRECLSQILLHSEKPVTVLINDYEFPKYWHIFVKVMQKYPDVKESMVCGRSGIASS